MLFLFWVIPFLSFAKAILYEGRDGLSSNDISVIAKDDRGLMWIGTHNGINIYDGYTFTKLHGVLSNLQITTLAINNSKNELLAGTNLGLFSVDLYTFKVTKIGSESKNTRFWSNAKVSAICIVQGTKKRVFASFGSGYLAEINNSHKLELICHLTNNTNEINSIVPGDQDNLLVSNDHIYNIDLKTRTSTEILTLKNAGPFKSITRSGNMLLVNEYHSKLFILDSKNFTDITSKVFYGQKKPFPYHVHQSLIKNNKLYILSDNYTFVIIDMGTGYINEVSKKYPDIFEGKTYFSIFVDEHDIIWIATNKGLIKVEERPELFTKELFNLPARVSTRKMIEDVNGDIYVSSYIGLWHFSKQTQTWHVYNKNTDEVIKTNPVAFEGVVQPLALLPVYGTSYLYVGFDSDKLLRFDRRKKVFENIIYTEEHKRSGINSIYALIQDKKGTIWVGCGNGLASYNPKLNKLILHRKDAFDIGNTRVRYIIEDARDNLIYVASTSGLHIIDLEQGIVNHLNQSSRPALTNNDVLYVGQDKEHRLWLGTNGGGINILSADLKSVQSIHKQDGLSSEIVYGIMPQDENTYWISTFNGLDRYRKDLKSFSNFFEEDGLSSNEFNQNSFLKTNDGKMYFGSINGVTSFYPKLFNLSVPFKIYLSGISQWDDKTQAVQLIRNKIVSNNTLVKRPSDLLYELHFACTDYSDPLRNSYSYRIKELADNWISLEDRHTLNVGGIPYGTYTLEVKAINSRGASSENMLLFHIQVVQPFYKTWWFFALILTGIAIIFYAAYLLKYQSFKNILHLRMKIASNLHDEVGSLLTRITMFSDNLRYSKNNEEQRNIKLEKIAALSRDAIASMSDVLWTIDSRNDFAGNLLDRMREHTEEMLFPLGIDVNFVLSGTDLKQPISSDMRGELYLIFKEAINNIARHSEATKVDILYQVSDKSFLLTITNNGATEDINELSTGQGLSNMKMRAAKAGATIQVKKEGEIFSVEIKN